MHRPTSYRHWFLHRVSRAVDKRRFKAPAVHDAPTGLLRLRDAGRRTQDSGGAGVGDVGASVFRALRTSGAASLSSWM